MYPSGSIEGGLQWLYVVYQYSFYVTMQRVHEVPGRNSVFLSGVKKQGCSKWSSGKTPAWQCPGCGFKSCCYQKRKTDIGGPPPQKVAQGSGQDLSGRPAM